MDDRPETEGTRRARCPICGKATVQDYRPFCSRRCADVDLSRWLRGAYAVRTQSDDDEEDGVSSTGGGVTDQGAGQSGRDDL